MQLQPVSLWPLALPSFWHAAPLPPVVHGVGAGGGGGGGGGGFVEFATSNCFCEVAQTPWRRLPWRHALQSLLEGPVQPLQAGEHAKHVLVSVAKYCASLHDASVCCTTHLPAAHDDLVPASHASLLSPLGSMVPTRAWLRTNVLLRTTPSFDRMYSVNELNRPEHCVPSSVKHANLSHSLLPQCTLSLMPVTSLHCDVSLQRVKAKAREIVRVGDRCFVSPRTESENQHRWISKATGPSTTGPLTQRRA